MRITTNTVNVVLGLIAFLLSTQVASCFYNPRTGRWLNRDSIAEAGFTLLTGGQQPRTQIEFDEELFAGRRTNPRPNEANLYGFILNDPLNRIDPSGLAAAATDSGGLRGPVTPRPDWPELPGAPPPPRGNYCGQLSMTCDSGTKSWPVYGNSSLAGLIIGSGCVTLAPPNVPAGQQKIVCSGTCDEIKGWNAAGVTPPLPILQHEACHACAYEDSGKCRYVYTWAGDLWGYCDNHPKPAKPMW